MISPIFSTLSTIVQAHDDMQAFADNPVTTMRGVDDAFNAQSIGSLNKFSGFPEILYCGEQLSSETAQTKHEGSVDYPVLPRSRLPAPRVVRRGRPGSVSRCLPDVGTGSPDSAGDVPLRAGWRVALLSVGHAATPDGTRLVSRVSTVGSVASIALPPSAGGGVPPCRVANAPQ